MSWIYWKEPNVNIAPTPVQRAHQCVNTGENGAHIQ